MLKEFGKKNFTKALKDNALEIAKSEVETLDKYLRGDIYGYDINDGEDSCWGYYGIDEAIVEAKGIIDYKIKNKEALQTS